ncbi:unnamed protein product, partial [marine sediment metagenome]
LEQGNEGALHWTSEGVCQTADEATYTTANGAITDSATAITINTGTIPLNSRLTREGGTEEGMTVTAGAYTTTVTATRATNNEAISDDDVLMGYLPSPTVQTTTVPATAGQSWVGTVQMADMGAKCEIDFDPQYSGTRGNSNTFDHVAPGLVSVSLTYSGVLDRDGFQAGERALWGSTGMAMAQWGDTAGQCAAIFLPTAARIEHVAVEIGDTGLLNVEIAMQGLGHTTPFVLAFGG